MHRVTIKTRIILIIAVMCMLSGCEYQDREYVSTSPDGTNTITIKYDDESHNGAYAEAYQIKLNP